MTSVMYSPDEVFGALDRSLGEGWGLAEDEKPQRKPPLPGVIREKGRNNTLASEAGRLRNLDHSEAEIRGLLLAINKERCQPPLDGKEVEEIARSVARYPAGKIRAPQPERRVVLTPASTITPRRVRWAWEDRLPLGGLALLGGRESSGKSSVAYERAARITRGQLEGEFFGKPKGVIAVATEDVWSYTVVPRLMAAGADLARVFRADIETEDFGSFELSLPDDIPALEAQIKEHNVGLVILDPLMSRIGRNIDTHKDSEVRQALEPIGALGEHTNATVLGIIHQNKTATTDPLTALMGSRAFAAVARAVLFVTREDDERLLCFPKSNLGAEAKSMGFRIQSKEVGKDPEDKLPIITGEVVWTGEDDRTARDVLEQQSKGRVMSKKKTAITWLEARLKDGPVPFSTLEKEAEAADIAIRTLRRAAENLGVMITREGSPPTTTWSLPKGGI